ncbi:MAG: NADH-quinone oxidoreductase subunit M [Acidobacteria bacterium]|nr:NADH-quinone oxidoreductase subunit M [Acidobacteriota bacterium]MBI3656862.1 NADH-quinone oxidoreductase subunit M [Acidobacteriota bacterium]
MGIPILNLVCYVPLAGFFIILLLDRKSVTAIKWTANLVALLDFILSIPLILSFNNPSYTDPLTNFRYIIKVPWITSLGAQYYFGIDGISLLLIMLTTLLGFIAVLSSWTAIEHRVKEYYALLLLLQTGMLGTFMALDFFLFYVFWEIMLVPMYFLIGVWGSERRLYSAIKFFLYTLAGSVLMLLGILALYFDYGRQTGVYTFNVIELQRIGFPFGLQYWVFLAFFVGFAIKVPMFPFHTWLPDAHTDAPTAGSVILAGVLLKMGTYGFVRFGLPLLPDASRYFIGIGGKSFPWMMWLCIIGIIYGALVALMQKDWKRLVAYSSVSHLGFCMLGIFAATPVAVQGGVLQMINHGLSTGALFLLVGNVYERRHTRLISEYGGLSHIMPLYATIFLIMTLSSIGMPGLNGFIGEFMILQGTFSDPTLRIWSGVAVVGIVLGAAYMLWLFQRTMFGEVTNPKNELLDDLNFREAFCYVPLIILSFWIGLYPQTFLRYLDDPVNRVVSKVRGSDYFKLSIPVADATTSPTVAPGTVVADRPAPHR